MHLRDYLRVGRSGQDDVINSVINDLLDFGVELNEQKKELLRMVDELPDFED